MFLNIQYVQRNGKNRGWPVSNRLNDRFNDASPFLCLATDIDLLEMVSEELALAFYYISIACIFYTNRCCSFHVSFRETCIAEGEATPPAILFFWNTLYIGATCNCNVLVERRVFSSLSLSLSLSLRAEKRSLRVCERAANNYDYLYEEGYVPFVLHT